MNQGKWYKPRWYDFKRSSKKDWEWIKDWPLNKVSLEREAFLVNRKVA